MLEKDIQKKIMKFLKSLDNASFDVTTIGMYGNKGTADIVGVLCGRYVAIEVKRPNKFPTALQKHWLDTKTKCGAICFVATSVREVEERLIRENLI